MSLITRELTREDDAHLARWLHPEWLDEAPTYASAPDWNMVMGELVPRAIEYGLHFELRHTAELDPDAERSYVCFMGGYGKEYSVAEFTPEAVVRALMEALRWE